MDLEVPYVQTMPIINTKLTKHQLIVIIPHELFPHISS